MYYIYLLKSKKDGSIYLGYTSDLQKRLADHNGEKNISTRFKIPWKLIYYEAYKSKQDATLREKRLKYHARGMIELKKRLQKSLDGNGEG
ncbi:MAG: putative endonuclease [Microgenomates group bacterium Gr01-1014_5]|nr:MAG: putative endonuclease [Microgenomates group bacterium Gr01-1014_5]